ncbi:hypothetical protein NQZ68_033605 [Dissostichus eleginoides]|nr:hypothetical protein NQZ68_033605 [Dissostichus eleginoides]
MLKDVRVTEVSETQQTLRPIRLSQSQAFYLLIKLLMALQKASLCVHEILRVKGPSPLLFLPTLPTFQPTKMCLK